MKNKQNHKKGFTLIELLVVVAIMGMLAALAVVALNNARARARDARRISDIKQIQTALELYFLDNNDYPAGAALHLGSAGDAACLSDTGFADACGTETTYMGVVPLNPAPYDDNDCIDDTSAYIYDYDDVAGASYHITYCIGGPIGQLAEDEHTATPAGMDD